MTPEQGLALLGFALKDVQALASLHEGVASRQWLVERAAGRFVLRIDKPAAARLALDRHGELQILRAVSAAGLAPEPVAARPESGVLLTRWLPGRTWAEHGGQDESGIRRLAALVKRVHGLWPTGPRLALRNIGRRYATIVATAEATRCAAEIGVLQRRIAAEDRPACLCHNDLHPANLLLGRRWTLIDWEYAATGDPYFDVAGAIRQFGFSKAEAELFVDVCLGRPVSAVRAALDRNLALFDRVQLLWLLAAGATGGPAGMPEREIAAVRARIEGRPLP